MASTMAFFTGVSGLNAHARRLDVISNNIANVNTTAFKSSRAIFETQFSRTLREGSKPNTDIGGSDPYQVGMGVKVAGTQRNMTDGTISGSGNQRDLAIEGDGFFVLRQGTSQVYTRAGDFRADALQNLVTVDGDVVQGYGVDSNFNIITGAVKDVKIPLGSMTIAEATTTVRFAGNLNADGDLPTHGSLTTLMATLTEGFSLISTATVPALAPDVLTTDSLLTEIEDPLLPGSDTPMFSSGQTLEIRNAERGNRVLPEAQLLITTATTVQEFLGFLNEALGINTNAGNNPDGQAPGAVLDQQVGGISIIGNTGTVNSIELDSSDIRLLDSGGNFVRQPFVALAKAKADGESVRTSFNAFDSLGTPVEIDLAMVIESKSNTGTTWRYFAESADDSDIDLTIGTGTVSFDSFGQLTDGSPISVKVDRDGTGAVTPLVLSLELSGETDNVTSLTDVGSTLAATFQDGAPIGTLVDYSIGSNGIISGLFSNNVSRTLGQIALASFTNAGGLVDEGNSVFRAGGNSGEAVITEPGLFGTGRIVAGAVELSNVDLSQEFIELILTSTGYSASTRVISTANDLLQQLLLLGR